MSQTNPAILDFYSARQIEQRDQKQSKQKIIENSQQLPAKKYAQQTATDRQFYDKNLQNVQHDPFIILYKQPLIKKKYQEYQNTKDSQQNIQIKENQKLLVQFKAVNDQSRQFYNILKIIRQQNKKVLPPELLSENGPNFDCGLLKKQGNSSKEVTQINSKNIIPNFNHQQQPKIDKQDKQMKKVQVAWKYRRVIFSKRWSKYSIKTTQPNNHPINKPNNSTQALQSEPNPENKEYIQKIIIGQTAVGKTSLLNFFFDLNGKIGLGDCTSQIQLAIRVGNVQIFDSDPLETSQFNDYSHEQYKQYCQYNEIYILYCTSLKNIKRIIQKIVQIRGSSKNIYFIRTKCDTFDIKQLKTYKEQTIVDKNLLIDWGLKSNQIHTFGVSVKNKDRHSFDNQTVYQKLIK